MSKIVEAHRQEDKNAKMWSLMLTAPQDHVVRAPSNTPFLASKSRFVRSIDIPYSATNSGAFSVVAFPDPIVSLGVTGAPATFPASSQFVTVNTGVTDKAAPIGGYLADALLVVANSANDVIGTTNFVDLGIVTPLALGRQGILVNVPVGGTISCNVSSDSMIGRSSYIRMVLVLNTGGVYSLPSSTVVSVRSSTSTTYTVPVGSSVEGVIIRTVDHTGAPVTTHEGVSMFSINMSIDPGQFPISTGAVNYGISRTDLAEEAKISLQRCTAMSMLVTNLAAPLDSGGELVAARAELGLIGTTGGVPALMSHIKQLPEQLYWRSGAIADGSYSWWLPPDLASYEPHPIGAPSQSENVLIAAGQMSNPNGHVRIIVTWVFEFYSPRQVFDRNYNSTYCEAHRDVWNMLVRQPATSENAGHLALIGGLATMATGIYDFYIRHKDVIDPIGRRATDALMSSARAHVGKGGPQPVKQAVATLPKGRPPRGQLPKGKPPQNQRNNKKKKNANKPK